MSGREVLPRESPHRVRRHRAVPPDVFGEVVWIVAVVVVHIQPIGNAAEAADRLETLHHPCLDPVARPLNLGRIRSLVAEAIQLFIERRLDFFRRVAGPRSDRNVEHRAER